MADKTYRYRWFGINVTRLSDTLLPTAIVATEGPLPPSFMNITIEETTKDSLDEIMANQGWGFEAEVTAGDLKGLALKQVIQKQVTVDDNTTLDSFTTLLSQNITTDVGFLEIFASMATNALVTPGYIRLLYDFAVVADGGAGHIAGLGAQELVKRIPVTAGVHTVELQWRTEATGTLQCRPVSQPDQEHATLLLRETT